MERRGLEHLEGQCRREAKKRQSRVAAIAGERPDRHTAALFGGASSVSLSDHHTMSEDP
jgi:hypothetical protein